MAAESLTAQVTEQVAENLEETAAVVRKFGISNVTFLGVGLAVGAAVGFYFGHRLMKEKLRAEAFKQSNEELAELREMYYSKLKAMEPKPTLDEVVEEKGYVVVEETERPTRPPVPVEEPKLTEEQQKAVDEVNQRRQELNDSLVWDYEKEVRSRSKNHPYVIHQDEYNENTDEYQQLTWTYYASDNILADENDEQVSRPELIVGLESLMKFGHGSDDSNVVFVRNERLELDFEVCRLFKSYVVEVQGLDDTESNETQP